MNATFLCVIHENPNSSKARGHLGTELANKATTIIQVAHERDGQNQLTGLIKLEVLKQRVGAKPDPIMLSYDEEERGLVQADEAFVQQVAHSRQRKAPLPAVAQALGAIVGDQRLKRTELLALLCNQFDASERVLEQRIKSIMETGTPVEYQDASRQLGKESQNGEVYYFLQPKQ